MKENWKEPAMDTRYLCDDGVVRTWGELVGGLEADVYPSRQIDYEDLMWAFGAEPVA